MSLAQLQPQLVCYVIITFTKYCPFPTVKSSRDNAWFEQTAKVLFENNAVRTSETFDRELFSENVPYASGFHLLSLPPFHARAMPLGHSLGGIFLFKKYWCLENKFENLYQWTFKTVIVNWFQILLHIQKIWVIFDDPGTHCQSSLDFLNNFFLSTIFTWKEKSLYSFPHVITYMMF